MTRQPRTLLRRDRRSAPRLLIVGATGLAGEIVAAISATPARRYALLGVVAERSGPTTLEHGCAVIGTVDNLGDVVDRVRPDLIVVALSERRGALPVRELLECRLERGIAVEDGVEFHERLTGRVAVDTLRPSSLIFSQALHSSRRYPALARAGGVALSLAGLVLLAPLLGLIALAIRLDSAGPILFVQHRVGACGRPFRLLKFRTMRNAGCHASEWVRDNRDRITRVGRWLRKFRLDELPQLVNVLRGDMNLIGPRPHPVSNLDTLRILSRNLSDVTGIDVPYYALRTLVRPGITGWAQVRYGYANSFDEELEKLRYDLYYIKHASLGLDLRILFETVRVVVRGHETGEATDAKDAAGARTASGWRGPRESGRASTA